MQVSMITWVSTQRVLPSCQKSALLIRGASPTVVKVLSFTPKTWERTREAHCEIKSPWFFESERGRCCQPGRSSPGRAEREAFNEFGIFG